MSNHTVGSTPGYGTYTVAGVTYNEQFGVPISFDQNTPSLDYYTGPQNALVGSIEANGVEYGVYANYDQTNNQVQDSFGNVIYENFTNVSTGNVAEGYAPSFFSDEDIQNIQSVVGQATLTPNVQQPSGLSNIPPEEGNAVINEEELKQNCDALGKDCKIAVYKKPDNPDELGIGVYYNNGIDFTVTTNDVDQPFNIYENKNVDATTSDFLLDRHEITVLNGKLFHRRNNKCNSDSLKVSQSDDVVIMTESFKLSSNALMTQYHDRIHIYDGTLDLRHYSDS